ncbi:MAG: ribosomal-processing cysteine protease Prp [Sporolactobacillus sp.]
MITLKVSRSAVGQITRFQMTGHAESGPYGYDLVCAGASAVAFGSLNALEQLTKSHPDVKQKAAGGFLECCFSDTLGADQDKAQLILEAMLISMRTIERSYGKYLRIIDKGGVDLA